ncbi:MAG: hypothetical protein LBF06_15180 [Pseudomonas sp.]|jgi:predicted alpha/beta hydrolase family esterase|nr:hypothetical protein [Pseudomonas sp.]
MKRTKSVFIHGFNNDNSGWEELLSYWEPFKTLPKILAEKRGEKVTYDSGAAFPTEIMSWKSGSFDFSLQRLWDAYKDQGKILEYFDIWDKANSDAIELGKSIAQNVNKFYTSGEKVVLSAHSLGSVAALEAAKNIRPDINIYIFILAGSAPACDFNRTIDAHENIKLVTNIYSTEDVELQILFRKNDSFHPVGLTAISSARNIETNFKSKLSHSDYKSNSQVKSIFRDFTKSVAEHC